MKAFSTLIVAGSLVCVAPLAQACDMKGCPQGGRMMEQMDQNKDGSISKKEYDSFHSGHFKDMDANNDGKVTQAEMDGLHKKMMDKCDVSSEQRFNARFDEVDINNDGLLSKDEAETGMPMLSTHFDDNDTDKDGKISKEEMNASMKKMHEKMQEKHKNGGMMMKRDQ